MFVYTTCVLNNEREAWFFGSSWSRVFKFIIYLLILMIEYCREGERESYIFWASWCVGDLHISASSVGRLISSITLLYVGVSHNYATLLGGCLCSLAVVVTGLSAGPVSCVM